MKKITILLVFIISSLFVVSAYAQNVNKSALGFVYSFGVLETKLSNGIVVGGGEYVITPTTAVFEMYTDKTGSIIEFPVFLSVATGEAYECKTVFASSECNLALLKLSRKIDVSMKISSSKEIGAIPVVTMGQITSGEPVKKDYRAYVTGIDRVEKDNLLVGDFVGFRSRYGAQCDDGEIRTVFLCNLSDKNNAPLGSIVTTNRDLIGIFNAILSISTQRSKVNHGHVILAQYALKEIEDRKIEFNNVDLDYPKEDNFEIFNMFDVVFNLIESEDLATSITAIEKLIEKVEDSDVLYEFLGLQYDSMGKIEEANKAYEKSVNINPNNILSLVKLADVKNIDDRISNLESLSEKYPEDVRIYISLINAYMEKKNGEKALKALEKAEKISTDNPVLMLYRVKVEKFNNKFSDSMANAEKLMSFIPNWYAGLDFSVNLYLDTQNFDNAEKVAEKMIKISPTNPDTYVYLAEALIGKGEKEKAAAELNKAKEIAEDNSEVLDLINKILEKTK